MARSLKRPKIDHARLHALAEQNMGNDVIAERLGISTGLVRQIRKVKYNNDVSFYREMIKAAEKVGRSPQIVRSRYCDLIHRCIVTEYEGPYNVPYRGVPTGWSE